jgi:hypothetical protein
MKRVCVAIVLLVAVSGIGWASDGDKLLNNIKRAQTLNEKQQLLNAQLEAIPDVKALVAMQKKVSELPEVKKIQAELVQIQTELAKINEENNDILKKEPAKKK